MTEADETDVMLFIGRMASRELQNRKKKDDKSAKKMAGTRTFAGVIKFVRMCFIEVAICTVMFLSGLRRSEIFALKPEDLAYP
jgi:hypothetical protein